MGNTLSDVDLKIVFKKILLNCAGYQIRLNSAKNKKAQILFLNTYGQIDRNSGSWRVYGNYKELAVSKFNFKILLLVFWCVIIQNQNGRTLAPKETLEIIQLTTPYFTDEETGVQDVVNDSSQSLICEMVELVLELILVINPEFCFLVLLQFHRICILGKYKTIW